MRIFVGNLSGETTGNDLRQVFESFGQVRSITVAMDQTTGTSRGFAFVIMPVADEAKNAIEKMNGRELQGRKIHVDKSRTKTKPHAVRRQLRPLESRRIMNRRRSKGRHRQLGL